MNKYTKDTHILRYQTAEDILGRIRDYILTNTDKLNDFTEGSALETLIEAIATELELCYQLSVNNIKGSIDQAIYSAFNLNRLPETRAYGDFIIDFGEPTETALQIPAGIAMTSSHSDYNQVYKTIEAYNVPAGTETYEVTGFCTEGGSFGNIPARVINRVTNYGEATNVINPTSISTGEDSESLADVKMRFRNLIQALARATPQALQYGVMAADPRVQGAFVDESVGYVRVYCHDANGALPYQLQKKLQKAVINWRPAGIPVEILPCHRTIVDVGITLDVPNPNMRTRGLLSAVKSYITRYINTRQASQDLVHNNIVTQAMNLGSWGIDNCQVNLYVTPDQSMLDGAVVNTHNNIIYNEHVFNKKLFTAPLGSDEFNRYLEINRDLLVPKDRARFDKYVHTPGDYDNPPYLSNNHGDGYLHMDVYNTTDTNGDLDDSLDNMSPSPLPSLASGYKMRYENSVISSLDQSANSAGHLFRYSEASASAVSMANDEGVAESLSNQAVSNVESSLVDSISESAEDIDAAFNSSEAYSEAKAQVENSAYPQMSLYDNYMTSMSNSAENNGEAFNSSSADDTARSLVARGLAESVSASDSEGDLISNPTVDTASDIQMPVAVSAGDATEGQALRVVNRYNTQGNEILRCGNVVVDYNNSHFN